MVKNEMKMLILTISRPTSKLTGFTHLHHCNKHLLLHVVQLNILTGGGSKMSAVSCLLRILKAKKKKKKLFFF